MCHPKKSLLQPMSGGKQQNKYSQQIQKDKLSRPLLI